MPEAIAKINNVKLGWESHGIFTCWLDLSYGGGHCQGAGGYSLDTPVHEGDEFIVRKGTAYGMEWIIRVMKACGVDDWGEVKGRTILAVLDGERDRVIGIKPLPTEQGIPFMFSELEVDA